MNPISTMKKAGPARAATLAGWAALAALAALATSLAAAAPPAPLDTRTGTSLVKTPEDAEVVCAGVVISGAVSKYMEIAANAGTPVPSQEEALRRMSSDASWKTKVEPAVQSTCHCVVAKVPAGLSDSAGHVSVADSAQRIVSALSQEPIGKACMAAAVQGTESR